jgi:hypothetical protein
LRMWPRNHFMINVKLKAHPHKFRLEKGGVPRHLLLNFTDAFAANACGLDSS